MDQNKYITLRSMLPAGEAKAAGTLTAMLGQHQINIMEFCSEFNDLTANLEEGVLLNTEVYRYDDKTYKIKIKKPVLNFLLKQVIVDKQFIKLELFYDLVKIYTEFGTENMLEISKMLLSLLKMMKIKII